MSSNNIVTKEMFEEFKKEQQIKQIEFKNKQKQKFRRFVVFMVVLCLIISGITGVASYTMAAGQVAYTPRDNTWAVENTEQAINELRDTVGAALVGSIYSYMGTITPFGYLACDGTEYNIADYPRLADHINRNFGATNYFGGDGTTTFAVPDLRGEFLRGTGTNSHINTKLSIAEGSGSTVGTHQEATVERGTAINTASAGWLRITSRIDGSGNTSATYSDAAKKGGSWDVVLTPGWDETGGKAELYTTRPTNTSVLYIIKY